MVEISLEVEKWLIITPELAHRDPNGEVYGNDKVYAYIDDYWDVDKVPYEEEGTVLLGEVEIPEHLYQAAYNKALSEHELNQTAEEWPL